ncbi:MAG: carboxymuconolactone decarboxylase family protein [Novosphingobium sp.]
MKDLLARGYEVVNEILGPDAVEGMKRAASTGEFGGEIGELAVENVFGNLWAREGLGRRERSFVTLGILIALRATEELHYHFPIALRNGLTKDEIAEVIYHCSGYAGFPAAASARQVAKSIFDKME